MDFESVMKVPCELGAVGESTDVDTKVMLSGKEGHILSTSPIQQIITYFLGVFAAQSSELKPPEVNGRIFDHQSVFVYLYE